ncbi:group 1 glycosyl transferase [Scytonema sp. HK-05]|uniref:glycosyltransferase family 4 protein n=1 Tax=Scytonema sp. HK-05 TaxID=1137095 RepID=UPI000937D793|nr:glycosyltransferase [Scytonema sp. HK-05]OKH58260.1 glycosyl transferase family 1 [Scytonema sp. HK-05]BAY48393.1 group 1 glycosyl transferase [Scytonema sp. HK-05]
MKILMSAYSCEPGKGSEPGVGWNFVRAVAKYHDVWVLTRPDEGREVIEAELARNPIPNLHFIYFTLPIWGGGWKWKFGAMQLHYYLWQIQAYFVARRLHRQIGFDLAHHVTFVKYSRPSFLCLLPIPFIWGPVGGGEFAPRAFWQDFSLSNKIHETVRMLACWVFESDPFARLTAQRSVLAKATTEDTAARVRKMGARNVQVYSESGLPREEIARLAQCSMSSDSQVRFASVGRLLHWKGFHLGLRAFAQAKLPDAEYWVFGDGPEKKRLQCLADKLGIAQQVKFWNKLPREETLRKLGECTALVHPSLHDSGGWVCLEAMAAGRPVLCLDLGGPAVQVTEQTGFKVPAHTPEQAVRDLSKGMVSLAKDSDLRVRMGEAGRRRVSEMFDWEVKASHLAQLYEEIYNQQQVFKLKEFDTAALSSSESK